MGTTFSKIYQQHKLYIDNSILSVRLLILLCAFLMVFAVSCSSEDSGATVPDTTMDPDPIPDPDPDPDPVTQNDIPQVDDGVLDFMQKYEVPGAALAVSVNEKMVYSKGFGLSNIDNNTVANADDLFRIASISKTFTAAAIMKLIDEDSLSVTDKVFGLDGVLGDDFGSATLTEDEMEITIDHLLTHESGGWGSTTGDPIDMQPQLGDDEFIEYILNNHDLTNAPGKGYDYSNTGYWLLARIVESIAGQPFETYLINMLSATGISTIKTTSFRMEDREPNEVEYYGTDQDSQFLYTIASRRDGDGGVVMSAPDLLRFLNAIDGLPNRQDVISQEARELMTQASSYQALWGRGIGIWEQQSLFYTTGSLPGTRTWCMIADNGRSAVILFNYRRTDIQQFDLDFQSLLLNIVKDNSISWQNDLDQF